MSQRDIGQEILDGIQEAIAYSKGDKGKAVEHELEALKNMPDDEIDTSDIPERVDWDQAEVGKFYRPKTGKTGKDQ